MSSPAITAKELADKIIEDYKQHYSFPWQGESHMRDCIMEALTAAPPATQTAGMVMVPLEPTEESLQNITDALLGFYGHELQLSEDPADKLTVREARLEAARAYRAITTLAAGKEG